MMRFEPSRRVSQGPGRVPVVAVESSSIAASRGWIVMRAERPDLVGEAYTSMQLLLKLIAATWAVSVAVCLAAALLGPMQSENRPRPAERRL